MKTTDGGSTWTTINSGLPKGVVQTPAFDRRGRPLFPRAPTEPVQALAIDPVNPATLYGGNARGVFKTTDGGLSWTGSGLITQSVYTLAIDPANSSTIYVGTQDGGVFKSTDGGQSWSGSGSPSAPVQALAIDPTYPSTIYAATSGGGVFKSTDGGESWQPVGKVILDGSTVLMANFMNGNDTLLASRVYLWNPSASAGNVMVRVFTLPVTGGTAQELTSTPFDLGTLEAESALNIKLTEDILIPLSEITTPYTTDDGDLTLEFTIGAPGVKGATQVFNNLGTLAFGTYPLQEILTSNVSPTVLVANFMNGNDTTLASRIYVWNPSNSAGNVMVRVFTLERSGASTLLGTVDLGDLEATSARNIKLAEDILDPLGRRPHTDNGGNLMLEFTIQAANVRGAAQVFNNSQTLAFGVYTLQEIPTSNVSPTVLVANFVNGNDTALASRIYLWNPSNSAGNVSVRVFTLERSGASTLLGTVDLGDLEATSARNIKLAEDILEPLGRRPHTDNGGNLTLEFTIQTANVRGVAQVFNNTLTLAFGTYPLQEIPTSNVSPTVLVANFMNGNDTALASRVYLWNPSTSAGNVMVHVFTLERSGTSTLLGTVDLGDLEATSARNIKLAEDILEPLGRSPHTDNGGNLTLEFTIQAANVLGAAQVFNNSLTLAFGTYPIQKTP